MLGQQAQHRLVLLLAAGYRGEACILVHDHQPLILIEDVELRVVERLGQGRGMYLDDVPRLERRVELRRRLVADGDEAIV